MTVYVVDDDASVRRALGRLLKSAGLSVRVFASAEEFLESGVPYQGACLVADIRMPGMSGLELLQELHRRGASIPAILVTAHDTQESRMEAALAGAAGYFSKPVDGSVLIQVIEETGNRDSHGGSGKG